MWKQRITHAVAVAVVSLGWLSALGAGQATQAQGQRILATNVAALRKQVGREVTVTGRVARTGKSDSGMQFLNFADSELTVVCRPEDVARFRTGAPAEQYRGQDIEITGTVELYRGKVQIPLRDPDQIKIRAQQPATGQKPSESRDVPQPAPFLLRRIGEDTWVSPAGLRYQGRDPEGLSRVDHIRRHLADIPSREGPHGVFDGGFDKAFAVIDEAWKLARDRRLRATREGERSSFTVDMGRRIGYLGGRAGAARKHPPLSRVLIVFETGTSDVITAFPK